MMSQLSTEMCELKSDCYSKIELFKQRTRSTNREFKCAPQLRTLLNHFNEMHLMLKIAKLSIISIISIIKFTIHYYESIEDDRHTLVGQFR